MTKKQLILSSLLSVACTVLLSSQSSAQSPYFISYSSEPYQAFNGGTSYTPQSYAFGYSEWDEGAAEIPLPFGFVWFGQTYQSVWFFTNGFISFDPAPTNTILLAPPSIVPNPSDEIRNYISVAWTDLTGLGQGGFLDASIRTQVTGVAPNRIFTIQATRFKRAQNPIFSDLNYQIVFEEASSAVSIHYGISTGISGATVAIEDSSGIQGVNLMQNATNCGSCLPCGARQCGSRNFPQGTKIRFERPPEAELIGRIEGPGGVFPGETFTATISISNIGQQPTSGFEGQVHLSVDTTINQSDNVLTSFQVPSGLDIATSTQTVVTVTMPSNLGPGRYYLGLRVDTANNVIEADETNNASYDPKGIVTAPDLTVSVNSPVNSGPGETIGLAVEVNSGGAVVNDPVQLDLYLSTDVTIDAQDTTLYSGNVTLTNGTQFSDVLNIVIPLTAAPSPPTYRILAQVDGNTQIIEFDESNNSSAAPQTLTLSASDLEVNNLQNSDFAFRGQTFPASIEVANVGGATAFDFRVCAVISRNLLISVISDPILASTSTLTLLPGESARIRLEPTIETMTSTGPWYFAMVADCEDRLQEGLENNNVARSRDPIIIRDPAPDFAPIEMETSTAAAAGESLAVAAAIANYGNVDGSVTVRFVVSENPGVTAMDRQIYETTMPVSIAANQEIPISTWATLPTDLESGAYYIGVIVDPLEQIEEVRESNNAISYGPLSVRGAELAIVSPPPANAVSQIPYTWRFAAVGGSADYNWSLSWDSGAAPEGLSFDTTSGELSGTPTVQAEGSHSFTVVVESGGVSASENYRLIVTSPTLPLTIVTSKLPPALANESYSVRLVGVGGTPPYTWELSNNSSLPAGLLLSDDGLIGGEPKDVGAYTFEVILIDSANSFSQALIAIDIIDPSMGVTIATADIPSGVVGSDYLASFEVAGGSSPYTWRLVSEPVPGLRFVSGSPAQLIGTATVSGDFPVVVEVRDNAGLIDRNAYVLRIDELGDLIIETGEDGTALPDARINQPYVKDDGTPVQLRVVRRSGASAAGATSWSIVYGELPSGILLDPNTGAISGQPTVAGVYAFTVLAVDSTGDSDAATFAIQVLPEEDTAPTTTGDGGCGCQTTTTRDSSVWLGALLLVGLFFRRRRNWLAVTFVSILMLGSTDGYAQSNNYQFVTVSAPYVPLTNGTPVSRPLADTGVVTINLPFEVPLYGRTSRQISINANGFITVRRIGSGYNSPPATSPSTSFPHGYIAPLWANWCSSRGGSCSNPDTAQTDTGVYTQIDTTPGFEKVTVEYRAVKHSDDILSPTSATFSVTVHASGQIDFSYGDIVIGEELSGVPTDIIARLGIEGYFGRTGTFVGPCTGGAACTSTDLTQMSNTKISIFVDRGPDVSVSDVVAPTRAYPGLTLPVSAVVTSRNSDPFGPHTVDLVLLDSTETSTAKGTLLTRTMPATLAAYEISPVDLTATLPSNLPPGYYRAVVVADSQAQVDEVDENNNLVEASELIRVAGRAPDFDLYGATTDGTSLNAGESFDVFFSAVNRGNEPGNAEVTAYLSTNQAITTNDISVGSIAIGQLAQGQTASSTVSAQLPSTIPAGRYYLGLIVDPTAQVDELNESNNSILLAETIEVVSTDLEIVTNNLPSAVITRNYSGRLQVRGGNGTYSYRFTDGALPRGLVFDAENAEVYGIPLQTGDFPLEFEVSSGTAVSRKTVNFQVVSPEIPLTIVTQTLPTGLAGTEYAVTPQIVGGAAPFTWTLVGELPPGIFMATNGTIVGLPEKSGITQFGLEVVDSEMATATVAYTLEIRAPTNLTVSSSRLGDAILDEDYSVRLFASGGVGPYTWATTDELPFGLALTEAGNLVGRPEALGQYRFQVEVTDSVGAKDSNLVFLDVISAVRVTFSTLELPVATPNADYTAVIKAVGGTPPYTWSIPEDSSRLPKGLTVRNGIESLEGESALDFVLTGRFEVEGAWAVIIRVEDSKGRVSEKPFAIISREPEPDNSAANLSDSGGCQHTALNAHSRLSSLVLAMLLTLMLFGIRKRS